MYVKSEIHPRIVLWFCHKHLIFFAVYSAAIYFAFHNLGWKFLAISFLPIGTIGTAVAFYVGFKNNSSYERLWEGRKIWASISSLSRALGAILATLPSSEDSPAKKIIMRQITWCNALRLQLRSYTAFRNAHKTPPEVALIKKLYGSNYPIETLQSYLESTLPAAELARVAGAANPAMKLLEMQIADVQRLSATDDIGEMLQEKLTDLTLECIKEQGASERLKSFPFPRQYASFSNSFVWIFLLLLPLGLMDEMAKGPVNLQWLVIPFSVVTSWVFLTMEQVGDSSEDPFELGLNDVPLTAICREIEIDLLQMLGQDKLPERTAPIADVLL